MPPRRSARRRALILAVSLSCATPLAAASGAECELVVAAAVSLRAPLLELAGDFDAEHPDCRVFTTFGASSALAAQVRAGAPIDVLISASPDIVDDLIASGLASAASRLRVGSNRLVIVVPRESAHHITAAGDLLDPELRTLALPEPAVPLGAYARAWLRDRGLLERLEPRVVVTQHARATLAAVAAGHADAGIVYASDARTTDEARIAYAIPDAEQPPIAYDGIQTASARRPELAAGFLAHLDSAASRAVLRAAGLETP